MLFFSKGKEGGKKKNKKKIKVLPIYENVLNNVISHVLAHSSPAAFLDISFLIKIENSMYKYKLFKILIH
jgi:hypothetical protein